MRAAVELDRSAGAALARLAPRLEAAPDSAELARLEGELWRARGAAAEGDGPRQAALALELEQRAARLARELGRELGDVAPRDELRAAWAELLHARVDDVLASVEQWEPAEAAARLREVERELELHLEGVERARGPRRARLRRRLRRLAAEREERVLAARLEQRFGARNVARLERLVLALIFVVLGLLLAELTLEPPPRALLVMTLVDAACCAVFLFEFALKWTFTRFSPSWLRRHFLIDLLPSLPLGLIALQPTGADPLRIGRALRLFRLARVARYVRVAWPVLRLVRGVGFLLRGLDRLVNGLGPLLNREILLHPIRGGGAASAEATLRGAAGAELQARVDERWRALEEQPDEERAELRRARLDALASAREELLARPLASLDASAPRGRAVWLAELASALQTTTAEEVAETLEPEERARLARGARLLAHAPFRWTPFVGRLAPRAPEDAADAEVIADAARRFGRELERQHRRLLWLADLYGTITPSELVDLVGTALVRHSFRPAWRLLLFGGFYAFVQALLGVARAPWLADLSAFLERTVGTTLVLLGSVCLVALAAGWWMRRLASEATAFYRNTARAAFLRLTKSIKSRAIDDDAAWLDRRVLAPEARLGGEPESHERATRLAERVRAWLLAAQGGGDLAASTDAFERTVLVYRDSLDGVLFGVDDTHTSGHLLGNPALRALRRGSRRGDERERKLLKRLDADQEASGLFGPSLWRRLIAESLAQGAARLVVEYDHHAVPLVELEDGHEDAADRAALERWLAREGSAAEEGDPTVELTSPHHRTTHFTALHFLDDDPARDAEVARRFGPRVLERLRADRRALVRRVFGSFPLQELPRAQRVLNPLAFYRRWFAGGRALVAPLRLGLQGLVFLRAFLAQLLAAVREIRDPATSSRLVAPTGVEWIAARRKLDRTRGEAARACLWFRALADAEYLGLDLPGVPAAGSGLDPHEDAAADLARLDAGATFRAQVEEERARARADLARVARLLEHQPAPSPESARALALVLRLNRDGLRDALFAREVVLEAIACALAEPRAKPVLLPKLELRRAFARFWEEHRGELTGELPADARRRAWRALARDRRGAASALLAWAGEPEDARERRGRELVTLALRRPAPSTEQLVTLRAIQTTSLVELRHYRRHVARLGAFDDAREDPLVGPTEPERAASAS